MYRRSYYRGRSAKYSNETICLNCNVTSHLDAGETFPSSDDPLDFPKGLVVVPATTILGNRKVKNFSLKLTCRGNESTIVGALVYLPEGTVASDLSTQLMSSSLYEPNQNVIMTFIIPPSCTRDSTGVPEHVYTSNPISVSNRLARNLSSGDTVALILCAVDDINAGDGTDGVEPCVITGTCNYAIKY